MTQRKGPSGQSNSLLLEEALTVTRARTLSHRPRTIHIAGVGFFVLTPNVWDPDEDPNPDNGSTILVVNNDETGSAYVLEASTGPGTTQTLTITTPASGSTVDVGPVAVTATATPAVAGTTELRLYDGATLVGTGTVAGGVTSSSLDAGAHSLTTQITIGSTITVSAAVTITVAAQSPTVVIDSPVAGATVPLGALAVLSTVTHPSVPSSTLTVQVSLDPTFATYSACSYVSGNAWSGSVIVADYSTFTVYVRAYDATPGGSPTVSSVQVSSLPDYVRITTSGASFSPVVELTAGSTATVEWYCEETLDTITGLTPSFDFPGAATRHVRMSPTDGGTVALNQIRTFNVGFNYEQDAGRNNLGAGYNHAAQLVSLVEFSGRLTGLQNFCAANTPLTGTLDLSASTDLRFLECFGASLTGIALPNVTNPAISLRLCLEANNLSALDLNPVRTRLYDLRAAIQQSGHLTFAPLGGPLAHAYHVCIRGEAGGYTVTNAPTDAQKPVVEEDWVWHTSQSGALAPTSPLLYSLQGWDNAYSSVDLSGSTLYTLVDLRNAGIATAYVDSVCIYLNSLNTTNGTLNLSGNGAPTAASAAARAALVGRGWTVTTEPQMGSGVDYDTFNRADGAVGNGWHSVDVGFGANVTAVIDTNRLRRDDAGGTYHYQAYLNPASTSLPADYTVRMVVPHATTLSGAVGLIARWNGTNGVRMLLLPDRNTVTMGDASSFDGGAVAFTTTAGFPASWSVDQAHTIDIACVGTTITLSIDGQEVGYGTVSTNATATGTEYGICGEGNGWYWDEIGAIFA
jgi:hypothetical protein